MALRGAGFDFRNIDRAVSNFLFSIISLVFIILRAALIHSFSLPPKVSQSFLWQLQVLHGNLREVNLGVDSGRFPLAR
jgi:hypothetical protein